MTTAMEQATVIANSREEERSDAAISSLCNRLVRQANKEIEIEIEGAGPVRFKQGSPLVFGTPSYWVLQCHLRSWHVDTPSLAIGENLREETVSCLLGGYGIPAEVGLAAFYRLKELGLTAPDRCPSESEIFAVLSRPLKIKDRTVHYRFARQKSAYIAEALRKLSSKEEMPQDALGLREWLLAIPGIGLKTASWIVRNILKAGNVAIIDIHIQRAGVKAGFFLTNWTPSKDYLKMEQAFLEFATASAVPAQALDAIIWNQMRARKVPVA